MEAVKRFFSSPRFAVAGASNDANKFGYKRTTSITHEMTMTNSLTHSSGLVSPALAPSDTPQPTGSADLPPLAFLRDRPFAVQTVGAHADLIVSGDSTVSDPRRAARGTFSRHPCRLVAAGYL